MTNLVDLHELRIQNEHKLNKIPYDIRFKAYHLEFTDTHDKNTYGISYHTGYEIKQVTVYRDYDEHPHNGSVMDHFRYDDDGRQISYRASLFANEEDAKAYANTIIKDEYRKFKESVKQFEDVFKKAINE